MSENPGSERDRRFEGGKRKGSSFPRGVGAGKESRSSKVIQRGRGKLGKMHRKTRNFRVGIAHRKSRESKPPKSGERFLGA